MYRIRLYIVPEQDEESEEPANWWNTVKDDGRVTVTHRAGRSRLKAEESEPDRLRRPRNNRTCKKKVRLLR